jgi:photosystem II stability/assembly factor-like uncharacterized protein
VKFVWRLLAYVSVVLAAWLPAQQFSPALYQELHWRTIGPFRGGRTRAVAGVPSQPNVFYIGVCNGGVWKTTDYGHTWTPIFDREPTGSIGAIAVAASNPDIVYVASGEGLHRPDLSVGDGIYKSTDAGRTWTHLGLRDSQQIPQIALDPRDPNRVFAAVLGHPYGPNAERGIFRSTDGGQTFEKVLYKDENTGGSDVEIDPSNPDIVYAAMWEAREGPWENGSWSGAGGGIFKSTDGGTTWRQLAKGLPEGLVQANLAIAPSNPSRLYATVATNAPGRNLFICRSDDAGENWYSATNDPRPAGRIGGGDLPIPKVDPKDPDVVYSTSIVAWKSVDGGKTWTGIRGAPGGDDYQNIWINPRHPEIILLASDQGAIITVNGGQTWSSWYNQPTAQLYHVNADNAFPYRVCSGQQESGSVCISSRGNDGEITIREWHPVGAEEYGYAVPDPRDPDIIYGGKISRYDRRTGQTENISPQPLRGPDYRVLRTEPIVFSPIDQKTLYFASNTLWKTSDGGRSWQQISPDLTRKTWQAPPNVGKYRDQPTAKPTERGVIYAVAPSPLGPAGRIWAGTDDGLIHVTDDGGKHWTDVTPPQLVPFAKVSIIEASHFDAQTAYAAINTLRLDDLRPHILVTRDGGKTWGEIRNGIPDGETVNVVREDPRRKGLLFAGTERAVYVSFDDGGNWQSLRLNMPTGSVRDLIVKGDDLVAATHGRGFWILDDITPLRQLGPGRVVIATLYRPQFARRVRWDTNTDTPLPPDFPAGENPPDGAIINYYLEDAAVDPVTLEILDGAGRPVRRYSSAEPVPPPDPMLEIPAYWVRPPQALSAAAGMHRFVWDMHYQPLPGIRPSYPIAAIPHNTAPEPASPWVMPGVYTVRLAVAGLSFTQPLFVHMDPRVKTSAADLERQFTLSKQLYDNALALSGAIEQARSLRAQLQNLRQRAAPGALGDAIAALDKKIEALAGAPGGRRGGFEGPPGGGAGAATLNSLRGSLLMLMRMAQGADVAPTTQLAAAADERRAAAAPLLNRWGELKTRDLPALNQQLRSAGLPELRAE